jgi:plastocyanin
MSSPPRRRSRRALAAAGVLALAAALAACGSSGGSGGTAAPTATAPASTAGGTAASTAGGAPAAAATVTIRNFAFTPATLTVRVGTTVTWVNDDQTPHTVRFADRSIAQSPDLSAGGGQQSWSHTFTTAGTYPYICGIHTYMTGTVKVTG